MLFAARHFCINIRNYLISVQEEEQRAENYSDQPIMQSKAKTEPCTDRVDLV